MTQTRALMPDYLRLIALFGIVIVNVQFMAFPATGNLTDLPGNVGQDAVVHWLVNGLATLKTYGLFSFMFGVGLGFQMAAAERRGVRFGPVYRNRMICLLLLGMIHGLFLFAGDILVIYAVTGAILYLFRTWAVGRLLRVGGVLLVLQVIVTTLVLLASPDTGAEITEMEQAINTGGTFLDVMIWRMISFGFTLPIFLVIQGISALGWFCLGLAAVKSGAIDQADHPVWQRARRWCLVPGVLAALVAAAIWEWSDGALGAVLTMACAPVATFGYLGVIAWLARPPGPMMQRLLKAGGSSLSIYLGQSILLTTIFAPYGLGLWDALGRGTATALAIGVTVVLIGLVSIWRMRFAQGPFELGLRWFTYLGQKPQANG
ncbi:MAG: DUF418 domain-containing protein [Rhodobacteraceae bacterium]|nr:DUF418 domain-containing protein [Paracoccaceae bacterium]